MKNIVIAITIATGIVAGASSAQACGFFAKLKYNGACTETEYLEEKKADHLASGETFAINGNYAYTTVGEEVVVVKKDQLIQAYKRGGENAIIDLIGDKAVADFKAQSADDMWGEVVGKDKMGNLLDEKSISDFRDSLGEIDTSALSTQEIVDIINNDVVTVLHDGKMMTFASEAAANEHFGAVSPDLHPNKE